MPSNIDKQFIENLQNFTESLEGIVELLKKQAEKGDAVNQLLSSMDGPSMTEIADDIKTLVEKTDTIDTTTKKILEEVKATRSQKESGMFGKISNKSNKEKIVDGISVIMLIAGGVLAIGMAFKIVGEVDVLSVLSLGIAIYAMSKAFEAIANIKGLDAKKALMVGLVVVTMAAALVASGFILKFMPSIDVFTAFSLVLVGGALGVASFLLLTAISKMNLKPKDIKEILLLPLILPAIALGIVASSWILTMFKPIDDPINLILTSAAIGLAVLFMVPTMKILSKVKMNELLMGGLGVVVASVAIMSASWILSVGKYDKYPSLKWAFGVGLSIILFTPAILVLGLLAMSGIGALAIVAGAALVVVVSAAIVAVSNILSKGKYSGGPPLKWAIGTSLLIGTFGAAMLLLGIIPFGKKILNRGADMVRTVATTIKEASFILQGGDYRGGPKKEWAEGIALSLGAFAGALSVAMKSGKGGLFSDNKMNPQDFVDFIINVSHGMVAAADVLQKGDWGGNAPTKEWGDGVGKALSPFVNLFVALSEAPGAKKLMNDLRKSKNKDEDSVIVDFIKDIALAMVSVARIFKNTEWVGAPSKEWAEGLKGSVNVMIAITEKDIKVNKIVRFVSALDMLILGLAAIKPEKVERATKALTYIGNSITPEIIGTITGLLSNIGISRSETLRILNFLVGVNRLAKIDMDDVIHIKKSLEILGGVDKDKLKNVRYLMQSLTVDKTQIAGIKNFAKAVKELSDSFNSLKKSGIDKLNKFTASVTILSAVDKNQLQSIIGVLADNKEKLGDITKATAAGGAGLPFKQKQEKVQNVSNTKKNINLSPGEQMLSDKFDQVIEKFDEVLDNMTKDGQGKDAGSKDGVRNKYN